MAMAGDKMNADTISIAQACVLLRITRPTFDAYRKRFKLREIRKGRRAYFSKVEILSKITPKKSRKPVQMTIVSGNTADELLIDETTIDLRKIQALDTHGIISLLCSILTLASEKKLVHLLVEDSFFTQRLCSLGFFSEIQRKYPDTVLWDQHKVTKLPSIDTETFLPIQHIGYKGGERQISEELFRLLIKHGFSDEIGARIAWIFGELADNALTHGKGPCYLMCQRFVAPENDTRNYLAIAVGDLGVGIHKSLRTNPKYSHLDDKKALISAFKSSITSWEDAHNRGKGLTDVIITTLGSDSLFRVEAGDLGFSISWNKAAECIHPTCSVSGTRYSIVLADGEFKKITRKDADEYIDRLLQTL